MSELTFEFAVDNFLILWEDFRESIPAPVPEFMIKRIQADFEEIHAFLEKENAVRVGESTQEDASCPCALPSYGERKLQERSPIALQRGVPTDAVPASLYRPEVVRAQRTYNNYFKEMVDMLLGRKHV